MSATLVMCTSLIKGYCRANLGASLLSIHGQSWRQFSDVADGNKKSIFIPPHSNVSMPDLGTTSSSGTVVAVSCKVGDFVEVGTALCEIETADLIMELDTNIKGYVAKVSPVGTVVDAHDMVAVLVDEAQAIEEYNTFIASCSAAVDEPPSGNPEVVVKDAVDGVNVLKLLSKLGKEGALEKIDPDILKKLRSLARSNFQPLLFSYSAALSDDSGEVDAEFFLENALEVIEDVDQDAAAV